MILSNLSPKEMLKYSSLISHEELLNAFEKVVDELDELKIESEREERYYESAMEQSNFRRDVIEMILELGKSKLPRFNETKELIKEIEMIVENSYVEL